MDTQPTGTWREYLLLVLTTAIWGSNFVFTKLLLQYLNPFILALVRNSLGVILIGLILWQWRAWAPITRKTLGLLLLSGCVGTALNNNLFMLGVNYTDPANAAMVMALTPLTTAALAARVAGERLRAGHWLGIAISFAGAAVLIFRGSLAALLQLRVNPGDLIMLGAMLTSATNNIIMRKSMRQINPSAAAFWATLFGVVLSLPLAFLVPGPALLQRPDWRFAGLLGFGAIFAVALCALWWARGLQRLGAARTAIFMNVVPLFSMLAAVVLLHEPITAAHLAGFLLIVVGVRLGTAPHRAAAGGPLALPGGGSTRV